jgi:predicted metallopeptidase
MGEEKEYDLLVEGNQMVAALCQKYPKILWAVNPEQVVVLGITNKERPKKMKKLATIRLISPAMKTILRAFGRKDIRFYIEVYAQDFSAWSNQRRQVILLHEILHISAPDERSLVRHDTEDFSLLLDAFGIDYWQKESLPDLLVGDAFPFRQELADRLHIKEVSEKSNDDHSDGG